MAQTNIYTETCSTLHYTDTQCRQTSLIISQMNYLLICFHILNFTWRCSRLCALHAEFPKLILTVDIDEYTDICAAHGIEHLAGHRLGEQRVISFGEKNTLSHPLYDHTSLCPPSRARRVSQWSRSRFMKKHPWSMYRQQLKGTAAVTENNWRYTGLNNT